MDYSQEDIGIIIVHASDEMSKLSDILGITFEKKDEKFEKTRKRHMWIAKIMIPFYKEIGLKKVAKNLQKKIKPYIPEKVRSELSKYISKKKLIRIKQMISKIKEIEELR